MAGGRPAQLVGTRLIDNALWLLRTYRLRVTAAREGGHDTHGDGTALDLVPAEPVGHRPGTSAGALARDLGWTPACGASGSRPACALVPAIQFVGHDGYPGHGSPRTCGDTCFPHLHVSWDSPSYGTSAPSPPSPVGQRLRNRYGRSAAMSREGGRDPLGPSPATRVLLRPAVRRDQVPSTARRGARPRGCTLTTRTLRRRPFPRVIRIRSPGRAPRSVRPTGEPSETRSGGSAASGCATSSYADSRPARSSTWTMDPTPAPPSIVATASSADANSIKLVTWSMRPRSTPARSSAASRSFAPAATAGSRCAAAGCTAFVLTTARRSPSSSLVNASKSAVVNRTPLPAGKPLRLTPGEGVDIGAIAMPLVCDRPPPHPMRS